MLKTVEVLDISYCDSIHSLTGLTALKELDMRGVENIESGYEVFQKLTKLSIGNVNVRNEKHIIEALEKAVNLTSLTLYCSNLPFETLTQVQNLTLNECEHLTEFPATFVPLKSLEIASCRGLVSFPVILPSLQDLSIYGSGKLPLLQVFAEPNCPLLDNVNISMCAILEEIQITRRITKLVIEQCRGLRKISAKEFVRSMKRYE
jgi:hypothetical protein